MAGEGFSGAGSRPGGKGGIPVVVTKARRAPDERALLFVGTQKGAYVFESDFERETWKRTDSFLAGHEVVGFAYDFREGRTVYGLSTKDGLWRTRDLGRNWEQAEGIKGAKGFSALSVGFEGTDAVLYVGIRPPGLSLGRDGGRSWEQTEPLPVGKAGDGPPPGPNSILVDAAAPDRVFAAVAGHGVYRSEDGGGQWSEAHSGLQAGVHRLASSPARPNTLYASTDNGIYRSDDAAQTWRRLEIENAAPGECVVAVSFARPSMIFAVAGKTAASGLEIHRSRDGGDSWDRFTAGLEEAGSSSIAPHALVLDDCDEEGLYLGTSTGHLYMSLDEGETWEHVASGLPEVLAIEPVVLMPD
jgi:photosystem II stability/assembly factor-like uncharacterized protein